MFGANGYKFYWTSFYLLIESFQHFCAYIYSLGLDFT